MAKLAENPAALQWIHVTSSTVWNTFKSGQRKREEKNIHDLLFTLCCFGCCKINGTTMDSERDGDAGVAKLVCATMALLFMECVCQVDRLQSVLNLDNAISGCVNYLFSQGCCRTASNVGSTFCHLHEPQWRIRTSSVKCKASLLMNHPVQTDMCRCSTKPREDHDRPSSAKNTFLMFYNTISFPQLISKSSSSASLTKWKSNVAFQKARTIEEEWNAPTNSKRNLFSYHFAQ